MVGSKVIWAIATSTALSLLLGCSSESGQSNAPAGTATTQPDSILPPLSQTIEPATTPPRITTTRHAATQRATRLATTQPTIEPATTIRHAATQRASRLPATQPTTTRLAATQNNATTLATLDTLDTPQATITTPRAKADPPKSKPIPAAPKPKPFLRDLRAAGRWLDKRAIFTQSYIDKRSGDLTEYFARRDIFAGRFLLRLDPKKLSSLSLASTWVEPPFSIIYHIDNPAKHPLRYYETPRSREKYQKKLSNAYADRQYQQKRHLDDLKRLKTARETIMLRVNFAGPFVNAAKVRRLRKHKGSVVCEVEQITVGTDVDYNDKSFETVYKRYISQITVAVVEQR